MKKKKNITTKSVKKKNPTKILKAKPNTFIFFKTKSLQIIALLINKCWIIASKLFGYYKTTKQKQDDVI